MTYFHYESFSRFQSDDSLTITAIVPDVYYCNGTCYFSASIFDEDGEIIASTRSEGETTDLSAQFLQPFQLEPDRPYRIYLHAWTTKSVGIYTTGANPTPCTDRCCLWTLSAFATMGYIAVDHTDRGSIGFTLLGLQTKTE